MRSESESVSLSALPSSCINSRNLSSKVCLWPDHFQNTINLPQSLLRRVPVLYRRGRWDTIEERRSVMSSKTKSARGIARKFLANVVPGLVKPVHSLWNEVIGFLFLVLGVIA